MFIVIEGADASGKGTLVEKLKEEYPDFVYLRDPGSTEIGEKIRNLLLDKNNKMSPLTEAYLYASARAELVEKINKLLIEGKTVICERFVYSSIVYQSINLNVDIVDNINLECVNTLEPNLIILLKNDYKSFLERTSIRGNKDRMELRDEEYFKKVFENYDLYFKGFELSPNFLSIDTRVYNEEETFKIANNKIKDFLGGY